MCDVAAFECESFAFLQSALERQTFNLLPRYFSTTNFQVPFSYFLLKYKLTALI
jgi:hypothetical protein